MIAKIRKFFQIEEKLAFKMYSPDFGGRSSRNAARFSGVTRKVLSTQNIPCHVSANIKFEAAQFIWSGFKHTLLCLEEHKSKFSTCGL